MPDRQDIARLHANRLLRSPEEVAAFEEALAALALERHPEWLGDLHLAFDDHCVHHEVMFGLVHFLESFDLDAQLRAMLSVLPVLAEQAPDWVRILYYRILNDGQARAHLQRLILEDSGKGAAVSREILRQVVEEQHEPVSDLAQAVLQATEGPHGYRA